MLKLRCRHDIAPTVKYFTSDPSLSETEKVGSWVGSAVPDLGLDSAKGVKGEELAALLAGYRPNSVEPICQRLPKNRRSAWEVVFAPDKSISIAALCDHPSAHLVRAAFDKSVASVGEVIEGLAFRQDGPARPYVETGNIVAAKFTHETSREGDPHLHTHLLVLNTTRDRATGRWRSLEVAGIYKSQQALDAMFHRELARHLQKAGIASTLTPEGIAVIPAIPPEVRQRHSRAHRRIQAATRTGIGRELMRRYDPRTALNRINDRTRPPKSRAKRFTPSVLLGGMKERTAASGGLMRPPALDDPSITTEGVNRLVAKSFEGNFLVLNPKNRLKAAVHAAAQRLDVPLFHFIEAAKVIPAPRTFIPAFMRKAASLLPTFMRNFITESNRGSGGVAPHSQSGGALATAPSAATLAAVLPRVIEPSEAKAPPPPPIEPPVRREPIRWTSPPIEQGWDDLPPTM